jgi:hypothetical protein
MRNPAGPQPGRVGYSEKNEFASTKAWHVCTDVQASLQPVLERFRQEKQVLDQCLEMVLKATAEHWRHNFQKFLEAGHGWEHW